MVTVIPILSSCVVTVASGTLPGMEEERPGGLSLYEEFISSAEERELIEFVQGIEFRTIQMHGVTAKRRVKQFGWHYAFESYQLTQTDPIPEAFANIRARAAELASIGTTEWAEALVTEYKPGAGIGWHRDAPAFGIVAGISLHGTCRMRLRKGTGTDQVTTALELFPRSMYLLTGEVRSEWQHMIPPTRELRYSITFRTLYSRNTGKRPVRS
jgi:alkylated DNA repair dioxygenase AlkB